VEDIKMKCDKTKGVKQTNGGVVTKHVREVDKIIGITSLSEGDSA